MDKKFTVGKWSVTPHLCEISDGDNSQHLEPKSMALLVLLAQAKGELVTRKQIMDTVWKDRVVTEYALNNLISGLRKLLNTPGKKEAYIITRPKLGYQLIAPVKFEAPVSADSSDNSEPQNNNASQKPLAAAHSIHSGINKAQANDSDKISESHSNSPKTQLKYGFGLLTLSLILITSAYFFFIKEHEANVAKTANPSIVVLPFDVFDDEDDIAYFADGLAEEIIHQLTVLPNFKVISRTSSFYFRDKDMPLSQIAEQLDVEYVLEGSVRKDQDAIRVTLQLIEAASDSHIWSKTFTASRRNRFSIQFDISSQIAQTIDASFSHIPQNKIIYSPASSEAYLSVLRGRKLNMQATPDAYVQALEEFRMATLLEPEYAEAYADLAMAYLLLVESERISISEVNEQVKNALDRALELEPELANAHAVKAFYLQVTNQWPQAQEAYETALKFDPKNYLALVNYANLYRRSSQYEEAIKYYTRAKAIAPLSGTVYWGLANSTTNLGRFDDSIEQLGRCVHLLSDYMRCLKEYAYMLRLTGQNDKADDYVERLQALSNKNDFDYRSLMGFHHLWRQNFEASNALYDGIIDQFGMNNNIVMSMPIVKLGLDETALAPWASQLKNVIDTLGNKTYVGVYAGFASAAYYNNQCEQSIVTLEKIKKHRPALMVNILYTAHATSYLNILAHCYDIKGRFTDRDAILAEANTIFESIPENTHYVGGFDFVKAQHAVLSGNTEEAQKYIQRLNENQWSLNWLIDKDPILARLGGVN